MLSVPKFKPKLISFLSASCCLHPLTLEPSDQAASHQHVQTPQTVLCAVGAALIQ